MNKHKLILPFFLFFLMSFLHAQERNFEKEIQETEKQIKSLQSSIEKNNKEISKLQFEEKSTNQQLSITKKSIQTKAQRCDVVVTDLTLGHLE